MTTLSAYLTAHGHTLEPLGDPRLSRLSPGGGWRLVEQNEPVGNVAVWADPALGRDAFQPTVVVSSARITPAVDPAVLLDRLDDTAAELDEWTVRAGSREQDGRGRLISDTLGEYRLGDRVLTASTIAAVWSDAGASYLRQVVVTTFVDQLSVHGGAVRDLRCALDPDHSGPDASAPPRA